MIEALLVIVIIMLAVLIWLQLRQPGVRSEELENQILKAWQASGLGEKIGQIAELASQIKTASTDLEAMLRVPQQRGAIGEIALEQILSDQLPPDMFGVRQRVSWGKIPDAYIESTAGIICVDSKFPLEKFVAMNNAEGAERERLKKEFLKDVEKHLDKIAADYVKPQEGSAEFAFAFIPSEAVYYFLISEGYEMLRDFARRGVQVVSPLTLSHKIEIIKTGVHAMRLSEQANQVRDALIKLGERFEAHRQKWDTLYSNHLKNLVNKADEVNQEYEKLREEFRRISRL